MSEKSETGVATSFPEYVLVVGEHNGWVGEVRRKSIPAQPMTFDTTETVWRSKRCETEQEARALAEERLAKGSPW